MKSKWGSWKRRWTFRHKSSTIYYRDAFNFSRITMQIKRDRNKSWLSAKLFLTSKVVIENHTKIINSFQDKWMKSVRNWIDFLLSKSRQLSTVTSSFWRKANFYQMEGSSLQLNLSGIDRWWRRSTSRSLSKRKKETRKLSKFRNKAKREVTSSSKPSIRSMQITFKIFQPEKGRVKNMESPKE